jgi:two-component system sensor histidine kinase RegB
MPEDLQPVPQSGRHVRVDTLVRLRWIAVIGQSIAVLVVHFGLDFSLPLYACLAVIALAAWLNVALRVRFSTTQRLPPDRAAWLFAFDIAEIGVLLFLTGGLQNPFSFLLLGPVLLAATSLPPRMIVILAGFAAFCTTVIAFYYYPLPWDADERPLQLSAVYIAGIWVATLLSIGFIGVHAWQLTEEARQMTNALAATELVLAREQHLSQLDGLAAAAAHELGTPLATITVVATELARAIETDSPLADDIALLREQAQRCRQILGKLTELSADDKPFDRMPLSALLEEVVAPHRNFGVAINIALTPHEGTEPIGGRNPAILYGLGNLVENAVDFARGTVRVDADWTTDDVLVTITDDGPGFAPEIMDRIGDPYVTSPRRRRMNIGSEGGGGLGLGFFIAKTLLERAGATLEFNNRPAPERGAIVRVHWGRSEFEQPHEFAYG